MNALCSNRTVPVSSTMLPLLSIIMSLFMGIELLFGGRELNAKINRQSHQGVLCMAIGCPLVTEEVFFFIWLHSALAFASIF